MTRMLSRILSIGRREEAQDTFEYLLIVGVLVVAVVGGAAAFPGIITTVIDAVEAAIGTILPLA